MADIETECESLLNAEYYSSKVQYLMGGGATGAGSKDVKVAEVWQFDDALKTYTKVKSEASPGAGITAEELLTIASANAPKVDNTCKCENFLTEIEYTVKMDLK